MKLGVQGTVLISVKYEKLSAQRKHVILSLLLSSELQESNVKLKLTVVNTVGFGDQINKEERYVLATLEFLICGCRLTELLLTLI